ncbi:MAG: hypothetical protein IKQ68_04305 [Prevotella sp.]|nr:hypothetical protein [Prevotella sp.]
MARYTTRLVSVFALLAVASTSSADVNSFDNLNSPVTLSDSDHAAQRKAWSKKWHNGKDRANNR